MSLHFSKNLMSFSRQLFLSVIALFLAFVICFIAFQYRREKEYKVELLNTQLQNYNDRMSDFLRIQDTLHIDMLNAYVKTHHMDNLRVTVINKDGEVMFDNLGKTPSEFNNHLTRQEIKQALKKGSGFDISRISESVGGKFFYSAKYYDDLGIIIRSALPYNINLARDLKADSHYIWFALIISLVLIGIFYSFTHKLGMSIKQLQQFAMKADRNEPIDNDIQRAFPRNELGEISQHIIQIYHRLHKTKENLYIIPNATIIEAGVTVRVEPGTHIQFWSDDADDPYADNYIAYLVVNGKFLVEGTKENPVYIYPSQLMDSYGVEIGATSSGYVSLKYADITNFFYSHYMTANHTGTGNHINLADHCTFRNNYAPGYCYVRYLEDGIVKGTGLHDGYIGDINAKDCVFYKLAFYGDTYLHGAYDRCIFTQCGIDFYDTYKNCVFLDNAYGTTGTYNSSLDVTTGTVTVNKVLYRPETGTTYITLNHANGLEQRFLADALELDTVPYVVIQNAEEAEELASVWSNFVVDSFGNGHYSGFDAGIRYDEAADQYVWSDGTAIDPALDPDGCMKKKDRKLYLRFFTNSSSDSGCKLTTSCNYSMFPL